MRTVRSDFHKERRRNRDHRGHWGLGQHIVPDFFRSGDYWAVKSQRVSIQGRYARNGGYALHGLAFGGPFLQGHRLVIDNMWEGWVSLRWDGRRVSAKPAYANSRVRVSLKFYSDGKLKSGTISLPERIKVELVRTTWRGGAAVAATITMRKQATGQDGHCGRADGNLKDDTKHHVLRRWGSQVPGRENLFRGPGALLLGAEAVTRGAGSPDEVPLLGADPDPDVGYNPAEVCANSPPFPQDEQLCRAKLNGSAPVLRDALLPGCVIDVCVGGAEAAEAAAATAEHMTRQIEAAGEPAAPKPDGWYDGGAQRSCDEGCQAQGLVCTEEQLRAHNSDVGTSEELLAKIRQVGGDTLAPVCGQLWGEEDDVPNWFVGGCHGTLPSRPPSSFSCAARPRGTRLPKHRLCWCHAPK